MKPKVDLQRLLRARGRVEQRLKNIDTKIDHVLFRLDEDRRCFARQCPLDLQDEEPREEE